jgi:hypothetical protein
MISILGCEPILVSIDWTVDRYDLYDNALNKQTLGAGTS